jgi:hypothetical protein
MRMSVNKENSIKSIKKPSPIPPLPPRPNLNTFVVPKLDFKPNQDVSNFAN